MVQPEIVEGTGEELQRLLQQHPNERFRLVWIANGAMLEPPEALTRQNEISAEEEERLLEELAALGKNLHASPVGETYSRETLYADHD